MEHCYQGMKTGAMNISPNKFDHRKSMIPISFHAAADQLLTAI